MPDIGGMILGTALPIILLTVVILIVVFFVVRRMTGNTAANRAVLESGETAQAVVLKMWDTGMRINDNPRVGLLLEVRSSTRPAYQVELKQVISMLQASQYQPGQTLEVKIDPANPQHVVISAILAGANAMTAGASAGMPQAQADTNAMQESLLKMDAQNRDLLARGTSAPAKVLMAQPMGVMVNGANPLMTFQLEVQPAGRASFVAQTQGVVGVQSVAKFVPGAMIAVKYDPNDITKVTIEHS